MKDHLQAIKNAVLQHKKDDIQSLVTAALGDGLKAESIIDDAFIPAMDQVGREFSSGAVFMPEMMVAAFVMQLGLEILKPHFESGGMKTLGTVLMGTVKGDLHDIGKNIVVMMLEANGFKVIDLGMNLPAETIAEKIVEHKPDVLGLSALLTTTMPEMQNTLAVITEMGYRDRIKVIVGGAPVDQAFADAIGADGYAHDASDAVLLVKRLVGKA
jgi:5-methyltetrahydrofolate--homocysteine methyltransferase